MTVAPSTGRLTGVVAIGDGSTNGGSTPSEVIGYLDPHRPNSVREAAARLNEFDVVVVQHEFGIFGANDGTAVLDLVSQLCVPVIVTLHTVPSRPTQGQRAILGRLIELASYAVVMSCAARVALEREFKPDLTKIRLIPHGSHCYPDIASEARTAPVVLTWGLIGPGKGIEWGIRALARLRDLHPRPVYHVLGATHPNVIRAQGERYREGLLALSRELGVQDMLVMSDAYVDHATLAARVGISDMVLLPYDSCDQATSGVLVEAVGAGKPVVSTRFPHAVELLSSGAGIVVPHRDAHAIADALRDLISAPAAYDFARREARQLGDTLAWPRVAERYQQLANLLVPCEPVKVA